MSFAEWALVIYSIVCTITVIDLKLKMNRDRQLFGLYCKLTDEIIKRKKEEES